MNILLVEDDPFVSRDLQEMLLTLGYSNFTPASGFNDALREINEQNFDIALLDIDLKEEKNGIDIGFVLNERKIPFIYLSDIQDPQTFEAAKKTQPAANLDKPVSLISLRNSISLALPTNVERSLSNQYIVVPSGSKKIQISPESILYLKAAKNNCEIHLESGQPKRYLSSTPMGNVLKILNLPFFCQVHRSYVVNLNKVHAYQGGRVFMDTELNIEIPISNGYLAEFKSRFKAI